MKESIIQIIIAIVAFFWGYPNFGSVFIVLMTPFVVYIVCKQDASYLPALIIHCASVTSIMYAILMSMMLVCISKSKTLMQDKKIKLYYLILLIMLPIYLVLTYQRLRFDGDTWQESLSYTSYYLSFWSYLFCYLISGTFKNNTSKELVISLFVFAFLCIVGDLLDKRILYQIINLGIVYGGILYAKKQSWSGLIVGLFSLIYFFTLPELTFSLLFTIFYAVVIVVSVFSSSCRIIKLATSHWPYVIIGILMIFGIANYMNISYGEYGDRIDLSNWNLLVNRFQYKLFSDRAPFWSAGWFQLTELMPIFPIHNIPDITAYGSDGHVYNDISFGAHNTPLQLCRIFGFFMGGGLIICYIISTLKASEYFSFEPKDLITLSLVAVSFSYSMVLFLTGTAAMLPDMCLLSFGILGITSGMTSDIPSLSINRLTKQ